MKSKIEKIISCDKIGYFDDEYVYDIEVDDDNHTFIGNDILVHNSLFVSYAPAVESCDWRNSYDSELDFILALDKVKIKNYFKEELEKYAASYGVENKQDFELEKISEGIISIEKKKYISNIVWEDGVHKESLSYIQPKGVELIRSSTPSFAREKIMDIIKYLFRHSKDYNIKDILKMVRELKREFSLCVPNNMDDIALQTKCSDYEFKVLDDVNCIKYVKGTAISVKAAAYHNYLLNKNKSFKGQYDYIKSGDKIKYYHVKGGELDPLSGNPIPFAFLRGSFPIEYAPEIDIDKQFEKAILSPINNIIKALDLPEINARLSVIVDILSGF